MPCKSGHQPVSQRLPSSNVVSWLSSPQLRNILPARVWSVCISSSSCMLTLWYSSVLASTSTFSSCFRDRFWNYILYYKYIFNLYIIFFNKEFKLKITFFCLVPILFTPFIEASTKARIASTQISKLAGVTWAVSRTRKAIESTDRIKARLVWMI